MFTRIVACTFALTVLRDALTEGVSRCVTIIAAPVAAGIWAGGVRTYTVTAVIIPTSVSGFRLIP